MTPDPLADRYPGWSPYNYCLGNPNIMIDPDGRDTLYFNNDGSYTGKYSKGGKNLGYIYDNKGNVTKGFIFLDPSDVKALESTKDASGKDLDQSLWETNRDGFYITGLNLQVGNLVDPIVNLSISNSQKLNVFGKMKFVYDQSHPGGLMDFAYYKNPLGIILATDKLAVIGGMAYNRFDAGNYFWGYAMSKFGFSGALAQFAARCYEKYWNGRQYQDLDQTAIWNGATRRK
jgi:hypothetical protein